MIILLYLTFYSCMNIQLNPTYRFKYIMLLKLQIIISRNSFNFYLLFPKTNLLL